MARTWRQLARFVPHTHAGGFMELLDNLQLGKAHLPEHEDRGNMAHQKNEVE